MNRPKLVIRPLTPELWPALEDLFGKNGACSGCWCMYWRLGSAYFRRPHEQNRRALRALVRRGPPPGLLAFDGEQAVGWCQLTPRADLPYLEGSTRFGPLDQRPVWAVFCFYVRRGYRKQGVSSQLLAAAVKAARRARAPALEAYPVDTDRPESTTNIYTGVASSFARAGFKRVGGRVPTRPVMRYDFRKPRAPRPH